MNLPWSRRKNWQWRVIIWSSLFLVFGKALGHWIYTAFSIDKAYTITASVANKTGLSEAFSANTERLAPMQLIVDVRNDTANDYTIEAQLTAGHADFLGYTLPAGEVKRFTLRPTEDESKLGTGDIRFLSAPIKGSNDSICKEVHTLNFNLKDTHEMKQSLVVNLSSIASKMECN